MEGSESEAIFNSLNLNPQLFINEVLNTVDELVDGAFDFLQKEASTLLKIEGTERANDLTQGVDCIRNTLQSGLDQRLSIWEKYCLSHCFSLPEGFSLPKDSESAEDSIMDLDATGDKELDTQLDYLRSKIKSVNKESAELKVELQALERQSFLNNHVSGSINEAIQLYEQHSMHELREELIKLTPELVTKVEKLKRKRLEDIEQSRMERMNQIRDGDFSSLNSANGLSNATPRELQEFIRMDL